MLASQLTASIASFSVAVIRVKGNCRKHKTYLYIKDRHLKEPLLTEMAVFYFCGI